MNWLSHEQRMRNEGFEVFPKVVPAGKTSTLSVRPRFEHFGFLEGGTYEAILHPTEEPHPSLDHVMHCKVTPKDGELRLTVPFQAEQEYTLLLTPPSSARYSKPMEFRFYALEEDLFSLYPWKGDFHIHSDRSDGREAPGYVAACSRQVGMDFMAVTDHHKFPPSTEAIRAFERVPVDLRIFTGEEVHAPDNPVHIIHYGGRFSINELFERETYRAEVKALEVDLSGFLNDSLRSQYASCLWVYAKIREASGLSVFCHPYWVTSHRYNVPEILIRRHFDDMPFDAFELIGGHHLYEVESNHLQVARYHEERSKGKKMPIVGASDAHGCERGELFGWYSTLLWAPSPGFQDVASAVKSCRAVAVEALPGETPRLHGPFRLVKLGFFLLRELLPLHDALCAEEGSAMKAWLAGQKGAEKDLKRLSGRVGLLYQSLWGRG